MVKTCLGIFDIDFPSSSCTRKGNVGSIERSQLPVVNTWGNVIILWTEQVSSFYPETLRMLPFLLLSDRHEVVPVDKAEDEVLKKRPTLRAVPMHP